MYEEMFEELIDELYLAFFGGEEDSEAFVNFSMKIAEILNRHARNLGYEDEVNRFLVLSALSAFLSNLHDEIVFWFEEGSTVEKRDKATKTLDEYFGDLLG